MFLSNLNDINQHFINTDIFCPLVLLTSVGQFKTYDYTQYKISSSTQVFASLPAGGDVPGVA